MKWKDHPELWDEVLELSRLPAEKIKRTDKVKLYQVVFYGEEVAGKGGREKEFVDIKYDKKRLKEAIKAKGFTQNSLSVEIGRHESCLNNILFRGCGRYEDIKAINKVLGEEFIKVIY